MNDFLFQVDRTAINMLLRYTVLQDTALILVGSSLNIENYNEEGRAMTQLAPMDRIDQILSELATAALRDCITTKHPHTILEELDGIEYELNIIPHRDGALLAFLRHDRKNFDGSLRIFQFAYTRYITKILELSKQISDEKAASILRKQYLRMSRMIRHSELLHEPPQPTEIHLLSTNLCALCEIILKSVEKYTGRCIETHFPEQCATYLDRTLFQTALYNLLANAIQATPQDKKISLSLREDEETIIITVSDQGRGLDPMLLQELLSNWYRPVSYDNYRKLAAQNARPGFGLPVANCVAQLHGGSLFLSSPKQGGTAVHFSIAKQSQYLQETDLHAANIWISEYEIDELELSVFD